MMPEPSPPRPRASSSPAPAEPEPAAPSVNPARIAADDARIAAAAGGDRAAASALLAELLPRTRNVVRFLVRGDAEVDDFAQTALIEVLRSLPTFRGESSLTTWADRITVRTVLRQLGRRQREREQRSRLEPELRAAGSELPDAESYAARRRLAQVLDRVPHAQRQALVLHHVVGMSVPELAEELGVSFDTAKSRLRLGMERLRKHYLGGRDGHG
jgi:RNA polymerase sigma-70 factor, ECF subfamily